MKTTSITKIQLEKLFNNLRNLVNLCSENETLDAFQSMYLGFAGSQLCEDIEKNERESVALLMINLTKMFGVIKEQYSKKMEIDYTSFYQTLEKNHLHTLVDKETIETLQTMYLGFTGSQFCDEMRIIERESIALLMINLTKMFSTLTELKQVH